MGDGNFAIVHRSKLRGTEREYAIKIIDKSKMKVKLSLSLEGSTSFLLSLTGKRIHVGS